MTCNHSGPFVKLEGRVICACGAMFRELTPEATERVLAYQRQRMETASGAELEYLCACYQAMGGIEFRAEREGVNT
jgi:hypothetical protein